MYWSAKVESSRMAYWFMPVVLGALLVPMGYFIFRAVKEK
jgi:asparagine N-glycosylation enzyme membrane subunit Stt3